MHKVKQLRKAAGLDQALIAKYLNISTANYSKKENGKVNFSLVEAKKSQTFLINQ